MAERPQTQSLDRFGPAQSRAQVFSIFAPARQNHNAGKAFTDLGEITGQAADYMANKEHEDAIKERDEGLRDYVTGLVKDGQRIQDGELQPIESPYYMAGVSMGRGRRRGREVWEELTRWQADNPRPGLADGKGAQDYNEWLETGLAAAQEAAGVDPENMSDLEHSEYAGIVHQARQRDNEQHIAQMNREAIQEQMESISSDISTMGLEFDPEDVGSTYKNASHVVARARAQGLDLNAVRGQILTQLGTIARETGDTSVLENVPAGVLRSPEIDARRLSMIDSVQNQIEEDRFEGQTAIFRSIQDQLHAGNFDGADQSLAMAEEAGSVNPERAMAMADRINNQRRTAQNAARAGQATRLNNLRRLEAIDDGVTNGNLAMGVTYYDGNGVAHFISPSDSAIELQAATEARMGRGADAAAYLTQVTEDTGIIFPGISAMYDNVLDIAPARLAAGQVTEAQAAFIETTINMNERTLSAYVNADQVAMFSTARFLSETSDMNPVEAFAMASRMEGVTPTNSQVSRWMGRAEDALDDVTGDPLWGAGAWEQGRGVLRVPFFNNPIHWNGEEIPIGFNRDSNFDRDHENGSAQMWSVEVAETAARIAETAGAEAANSYIRYISENAMVVARQVVNPVGEMRGAIGSAYLQELTNEVGRDELAPALNAAFGDDWFHFLLGEAGEFNPNDPALVNALMGNVNISNVDGGVIFEISGEAVFRSNQQLGAGFTAWRDAPTGGVQYEQNFLEATRGAAERARMYQEHEFPPSDTRQ